MTRRYIFLERVLCWAKACYLICAVVVLYVVTVLKNGTAKQLAMEDAKSQSTFLISRWVHREQGVGGDARWQKRSLIFIPLPPRVWCHCPFSCGMCFFSGIYHVLYRILSLWLQKVFNQTRWLPLSIFFNWKSSFEPLLADSGGTSENTLKPLVIHGLLGLSHFIYVNDKQTCGKIFNIIGY